MNTRHNNTMSFALSPADTELIHRVLNVNVLTATTSETVNTGGNCMNDLYTLPDGRVIAVYEYGASLWPSLQSWEDQDYDVWSNVEWASETHWHINECETLEDMIGLWADNCELIFNETGSADDMLAEHGDTIAPDELQWVESFIAQWERIA